MILHRSHRYAVLVASLVVSGKPLNRADVYMGLLMRPKPGELKCWNARSGLILRTSVDGLLLCCVCSVSSSLLRSCIPSGFQGPGSCSIVMGGKWMSGRKWTSSYFLSRHVPSFAASC
jgi:hypothetical protein